MDTINQHILLYYNLYGGDGDGADGDGDGVDGEGIAIDGDGDGSDGNGSDGDGIDGDSNDGVPARSSPIISLRNHSNDLDKTNISFVFLAFVIK